MLNHELLSQVEQLSPTEKFEMIQFLMTELVEETRVKPLENCFPYCPWSPYDYGNTAQRLMSLLGQEDNQDNINSYRTNWGGFSQFV